MRRKLVASIAVALAASAGSAGAQTFVSADVTTNTTWGSGANPCPIILERPIFVKGGATLTILPGCIVRGQPRTAAVTPGSTTGTPGALIVAQTGRIIADASAANPIIMTTAAVYNDNDGVADDVKDSAGNPGADGFADAYAPGDVFLDDTPTTAPLAPLDGNGNPNVSLWGGLVVLGNAPTNVDAAIAGIKGTTTVEGLTVPGFPVADATYGGLFPHDSSGSLTFVSVRHAGDEIGNSNELNGITLAGVGDGTRFENIEVYANFDDGIEWFGGTVGGKNIHVAFVGDDVFDVDQGYTGINQFLFGSASGDQAGEWDGVDFLEATGVCVLSDGTCRPFSNPAFYNLTVIGSTPDAGQHFTPASPAAANTGIQMRHGFAGELANSIVVNTGTGKGYTVDTGTAEACPGFDLVDNVATCSALVLASTFDDGAALNATELAALACGDNDVRTPSATSNNFVNAVAFPGLAQEDTTFDPQGNASGKLDATLRPSPIDPRPNFGLSGIAGGITSGPSPVTFRGAFDRTLPTLWTDGWTVLSIAGLL